MGCGSRVFSMPPPVSYHIFRHNEIFSDMSAMLHHFKMKVCVTTEYIRQTYYVQFSSL